MTTNTDNFLRPEDFDKPKDEENGEIVDPVARYKIKLAQGLAGNRTDPDPAAFDANRVLDRLRSAQENEKAEAAEREAEGENNQPTGRRKKPRKSREGRRNVPKQAQRRGR